MEGFWAVFFLLVVLKIPVFGALWLIWWASQAPEKTGEQEDSGEGFNRWRPTPRPRGPQHGPSGGSAFGRRRGAPAAQRRRVSHKQREPERAS